MILDVCFTENHKSRADQDSSKYFDKLWRVFGEIGVAEPAPEREADAVGASDHHKEGPDLRGEKCGYEEPGKGSLPGTKIEEA